MIFATHRTWSGSLRKLELRSEPEFVPGYVVFRLADGTNSAEQASTVNDLHWWSDTK